jgi:IS30 family transposase
LLGKSIDLLSVIASQHTVEGQQESNTVVGKRVIKEAVAFSLLEKKTKNYIALLISGKASEAVMATVWIPKEGGRRPFT